MISPAALYTSIRPLDTMVLCHFDSTIVDDSATQTVTTSGSPAIVSTQSKFGGSCLHQPNQGTDTVNFTAPGSTLQFPGDFTLEAWVRIASGGDGSVFIILAADSIHVFALNANTGGAWTIYLNDTGVTFSAGTLAVNTWKHAALVRFGSTVTLYLDGTSVGTATNSATLGYTQAGMSYARLGGGGASDRYIDDFRISKVARYRANFTAPTAALQI